ncbi:glyoxalase [Mucilaginibacter sp. dw_454]|uniref:glyoxalase n=1 Tax=Mucilaginibacter sp. dw_454 TaxID=2720079 RepID=UPI001BD1D6B1|nr:glyoxalase [Mucilaginibacter sp. dw_454]
MQHNVRSIRPFIGAKDFKVSKSFYRDLGFEERIISADMSGFRIGEHTFYLQNADIKDRTDNTTVFLEVGDVNHYWNELKALNLPDKYPDVKLTPIRIYDWGKECFLHDPSGVLWHFGEFN